MATTKAMLQSMLQAIKAKLTPVGIGLPNHEKIVVDANGDMAVGASLGNRTLRVWNSAVRTALWAGSASGILTNTDFRIGKEDYTPLLAVNQAGQAAVNGTVGWRSTQLNCGGPVSGVGAYTGAAANTYSAFIAEREHWGNMQEYYIGGELVGACTVNPNGDTVFNAVGNRGFDFYANGVRKIAINATTTYLFGTGDAIWVAHTGGANQGTGVVTDRTNVGYSTFHLVGGQHVGNIYLNSNSTNYNTSSDKRLKENIAPATSASTIIDAVQVVEYDWKKDGEHVTHGVIAQDVFNVYPEAVTAGDDSKEITKDSKTWSVDYSSFVPLLLKEVQDLRKRVAALEAV